MGTGPHRTTGDLAVPREREISMPTSLSLARIGGKYRCNRWARQLLEQYQGSTKASPADLQSVVMGLDRLMGQPGRKSRKHQAPGRKKAHR